MPIEHVFVLMLENRSFDHMLGFSGLTGRDAVTGRPTQINGVPASASNSWNGDTYRAATPAVDPMTADPRHEFEDVVEQLCGHGVVYPKGGPYPAINNSGFVSNWSKVAAPANYGDIMRGFPPPNLTTPPPNVLNLFTLAQQFAVCDSWFCSLPGPTWPNRCFALAASSAGLDHSPTTAETIIFETFKGFKFQNGSIFGAQKSAAPNDKLNWKIYAGNIVFTLAHGLQGIHIWDINRYSRFAGDVANPNYPAEFTWIEPSYGNVIAGYVGGSSQHPLDGVKNGEALIKSTYEAIRNSPLWDTSMLIITWDEHGGYYDHVAPPPAVPPGDQPQFSGANESQFPFNQYGPRVPAVVISPLIPANTIDHRPYDHASIPATIERLFGLLPLTARDRAALDLTSLASLPAPRSDAPETLEISAALEAAFVEPTLDTLEVPLEDAILPGESIETQPNLPSFLYVASRTDAELKPPPGVALEAHVAGVRDRVAQVRTRADAREYFEAVRSRTVASLDDLEELQRGPA